ncbi:YggS family pyridoxal phosphate enzyme [Pseudoroseomonas deserti]|uniref:Pyridoxal phosphate homeostasis protein n=1 Tax=Teichococcus deserti TaxID=1817963 RepID=A0A1V2GXP8_9PROT|nr:YggS family pyridoxal phosphate-dependent enzyme [Pseudoroseomonas deserti]ONG49407.1 YggS family pyridoxal phosphate enzyme [Pseudoroseomonas deserti]
MSISTEAAPLTAADLERFGPAPEQRFRDNLAAVEARIAAACRRAGRAREAVRLLPITKTVPAAVLRHAFAAGMSSCGENKIQEATGKREALADLPIAWSIVGHLQTNKVKYLTRLAQEFHALDSLRLAGMLEARLAREGRTLDVFVQVNTSGEASKYGLPPEQVPGFLEALPRFPHLRPRGFMTLALFSDDVALVRPCFVRLRKLRDRAVQDHPDLKELSMGMTGDFEAAIEEGATILRVGQAIFGRRPTPDGHYWPGLAGQQGAG